MGPMTSKHGSILAFALALALLQPSGVLVAEEAAPEEDAGHEGVHHHVAFFIGGASETNREGEEHDKGLAMGLTYEARFSPRWGVGGAVEALGEDKIRDISVVVPISLHPGAGWRLFAGPGYEFTEKHDKALVRVGVGYEIELNETWSIAPEVLADFVDGGAIVWIAGFGIGFGF